MKMFKNEFGRSMVEMLGVLAIIGVLSIGSIAGYKYAMDKHRVNELISDVTVAAITVADQARTLAENLTVGDRKNYKTDYVLDAYYEENVPDGIFVISAIDVDTDVCRGVVQMGWDMPLDLYVTADGNAQRSLNDVSICGVDNGNVLMEWIFNSDLDGELIVADNPERCDGTMIGDKCCPAGVRISNGVCCGANKCCAGEFKDRNGECYACDSALIVPSTRANCSACSNREYTQFGNCILPETVCEGFKVKASFGSSENCFPCNFNSPISISLGFFLSSGTCDACPNREIHNYSGLEKCTLKCEDGFLGIDGVCYSCDYAGSPTIGEEEECSRNCKNRELIADYCMLKIECNGFRNIKGECLSCDEPTAIYVGSSETCDNCTNRTMNGSYCVLNKCAGFKDVDGGCHTCDEPKAINVGSEGTCGNCTATRTKIGNYCTLASCGFFDFYGKCYACDEPMGIGVGSEGTCGNCTATRTKIGNNCALNTCAELTDSSGGCYACDEPSAVRVGSSGTCGNCTATRTKSGNYCNLKTCAGFKDSNGGCYACDEPTEINVGSAGTCGNCTNREKVGNYCVLPCDGFRDYPQGRCYACDELTPISVGSSGTCGGCTNRKKVGNYCVLPCDGFFDAYGKCYACDDPAIIMSGSTAGCGNCTNRQKGGNYCYPECDGISTDEGCFPCSHEKSLVTYPEICKKCDSTEHPRLYTSFLSSTLGSCSLKVADF